GYFRSTYHVHDLKNDKTYRDDGIGGKLHFKTASYEGLSLGASVYASTQVFYDDNGPILPLRGDDDKAYAIIGELYLQSKFDKTDLKIGRQELNTPFADMDDVGMIPNTFEALTVVNNNIENTEVFVGQINKMAGVDAVVTDRFTKVNASDNMQLLGLTYKGIENVEVAAWYNRLHGAKVDGIAYLETSYEQEFENYNYSAGLQYAKETYSVGKDTQVLGMKLDVEIKPIGLLVKGAYNNIGENTANSGFGGGPFFASSEFLIVDHAGKNGEAKCLGIEYDASLMGIDNLVLGLGKIEIETASKKKSSEVDLVASYEFGDNLEAHMVYANVKGINVGEKDAKHFRVYLNQSF
ncbi:MAG: Unknown protein, partial [uncultured Sulfurovum sp.]